MLNKAVGRPRFRKRAATAGAAQARATYFDRPSFQERLDLMCALTSQFVVSEGGLEPPCPVKGTSTSS